MTMFAKLMNRWVCKLIGHKRVYTPEYRNRNGHVQADAICVRCGHVKRGWTGPTVEEIEEVTGDTVPEKTDAYASTLSSHYPFNIY